MAISHLLRDFNTTPGRGNPIDPTAADKDGDDLDIFERGYQAGWDDATKANSESLTHLSAELGRNLQDLSFTYHEAYSHFIASLKPMMDRIFATVLPELARVSLIPRISEQLSGAAADQLRGGVTIHVAPENLSAVEDILPGNDDLQVTAVADNSLSGGQALIRFSNNEAQVDLDEILQGIAQATDALFETALSEARK